MLDGVTRPMLPHLPGVPHLHVNRLLIFSNKDESDTFSGEKSTMMKHSGFFFTPLREKTLNQFSYSFSTSNLKVCYLLVQT